MSSAFFQGLVSPQYQIELRRRLRAVAEIESVQLARLSSRAEQKTAETPEDLVRRGLLPRGFGQRPDGSRLVVDGENLSDSLRGQRGSFLPIPDVPIHAVTRAEADRIADLAAFQQQAQWRHMDPLMVAIKRYALDEPDLERVTIDAWMLPFNAKQYGVVTSVIGPPTNASLSPVTGDVVSVQAVLSGGMLNPSVAVHHMFVGLQDMTPRPAGSGGKFLQTLRLAMTAPGYLGAWPNPGLLDLLPLGLSTEPDAFGFSRYPLGLWRRQFEGYSVVSFSRPVLDRVTPELNLEETDNYAQVRVNVADLSLSKISGWLSQLNYDRSRQTSVGNAQFLHLLSQQLRVPREDARTVAEQLLDVELLCTLGGEYEFQQPRRGPGHWASTAWDQSSSASRAMPDDYQAPVLAWFRGLTADLTMHEDKLIVHAEIDMKRKPHDAKTELQRFKLFGGEKKQQDKGVRKPQPESESSEDPPSEELPIPKTQ
jgi:hypothetical protein